jgi:hypothetical protein
MRILRWFCVMALFLGLSAYAADEKTDDDAAQKAFLASYNKLVESVINNFKQTDIDLLTLPADLDNLCAKDNNPCAKEIRRLKAKLWLRLLNRIDDVRDPQMNWKDAPAPTIGFPGLPFSGADPSSVADPVLRQKYQEAVWRNDLKFARYTAQGRFRTADGMCTAHAVGYLNSAYNKTPGDAQELQSAVNIFLNSQARKEQMNKALQEILTVAPQPTK